MNLIKPSFSTGYAKNASESANPNLWKGLVGAWMPSFGVTGNTLKDVSGNGNDGTLTNMDAASDWVGTNKGLSLYFDDNVHKVSYQTNFQSALQNSFTFSCLVNFNAFNDRDVIFGNYDGSSGWLNLERYTDNKLRHAYRHSVSNTDDFSPAGSVGAGWNFVNFTRQRISSTQSELIYNVNGKEVRRALVSYLDRVVTMPNFFLGADTRNLGTNLNGNIAFASIHNRALSPSEIKQLYLNPSAPFQKKTTTVVSVPVAPPTTTAKAVVLKKPKPSYATGYARNASESANPNLWKGLVGAWMPSFGVTGNTLKDVSGNGNDGTLTNMDAASDWVGTQKGTSLYFDNNAHKVSYRTNFQSEFQNSFTFSCLVKFNAANDRDVIFGNYNGGSDWLNFERHNDNRLRHVYRNGGSLVDHQTYNDAVSAGWNFVNFTRERISSTQSRLIFNVNGKEVRNTLISYTDRTGTWPNFFLGSDTRNTFTTLNGNIAFASIHNRALSPTEIKQLYLNPSAPFLRKQQTVGISTAQAFNPYWANQATQLAGTLQ